MDYENKSFFYLIHTLPSVIKIKMQILLEMPNPTTLSLNFVKYMFMRDVIALHIMYKEGDSFKAQLK